MPMTNPQDAEGISGVEINKIHSPLSYIIYNSIRNQADINQRLSTTPIGHRTAAQGTRFPSAILFAHMLAGVTPREAMDMCRVCEQRIKLRLGHITASMNGSNDQQVFRLFVMQWAQALGLNVQQQASAAHLVRKLAGADRDRSRWVCGVIDEAISGIMQARDGNHQCALHVLSFLQVRHIDLA